VSSIFETYLSRKKDAAVPLPAGTSEQEEMPESISKIIIFPLATSVFQNSTI
jgi:hypothetical protein